MTSTALESPDRDDALTPLGYALPASGPVPPLTRRMIELLRVERGDLVIDLCWQDGPSSLAILDDVRRRCQIVAVSPFGERLARLLATSGVRTIQMGALAFGHVPMPYDKVLLRGGFSGLRGRPRQLLSLLFQRLDPAARFLVVDSAPSSDAPLFSEGLRRWEREHWPAEAVAGLLDEAGFVTDIEVVNCVRKVPAADCCAWVASRSWPILETFSDAELEGGLGELRERYGSQPMIEFTARFEMVLGTKPGTLAE